MSADRSEEQFEQKEAKVTKANGTGVRRWSFDKFPFELVTFDGLGLWPADLKRSRSAHLPDAAVDA